MIGLMPVPLQLKLLNWVANVSFFGHRPVWSPKVQSIIIINESAFLSNSCVNLEPGSYFALCSWYFNITLFTFN